jgi:sulfide:quinone oxidoreductase
MNGFRVVIAGGGIAAVEGMLRVRRLLGDGVEMTVVAPGDELRYRPLAVQEPFGGAARRFSLHKIAMDLGIELVKDAVERVDPDGQVVHTASGTSVRYDALLLAYGARSVAAFEHTTTFDDANADDTYRGIVQDLEEGYSKRIALLVPDGTTWPLPIYELALQTADRVYSMGFDDAQVTVVTPERSPLAVFGAAASEAVAERLHAAGVRVVTDSTATVPENRRVVVEPSGETLDAERIVGLVRIEPYTIRGVPAGDGGFVPIDDRCRVVGLGEHVFAAGDATDFPIKQGGIGTQMADVAAAGIAALAGDTERRAFEPVLRGALIAGERGHIYMQARVVDGAAVESQVLEEPAWPAEDKVVAEELGDYLRTLAR